MGRRGRTALCLLVSVVAGGRTAAGQGLQRISKLTFASDSSRGLYGAVYDPTTGYAYFATANSVNPARVVKVDLNGPAPVEVGTAVCQAGEINLIAAAIDPAAGYAYFGTTTTPGRIIKVALGVGSAPPSYLGSTALSAGPPSENGVFGLLMDTSDPDPARHYLYAATASSPGIVVKLAPGAGSALPSRLGALVLAAGEDGPRRGGLDAAHGHAYFATVSTPASIVKIALGAGSALPTRLAALALPANESPIGSAVFDFAGGYGYLGTYGTVVVPAKVVKVALGAGGAAPTRVGALTLGAGERELSTAVGDVVGGFAFFGSDHTHPAKIYRVALGAGSALPTEVDFLQLAPGSAPYPVVDGQQVPDSSATLYGEIYLQSSVIDLGRGFAYFGTDTHPGQVVKVSFPHAAAPAGFFPLPPCRVVDTRGGPGPLGGPALSALSTRTFALAAACGVPPSARAVAANVTVTQPAADGDLRLSPGAGMLPLASTVNFVAGRTRANNAVVQLALDGSGTIDVRNDAAGTVQLILDVTGYFR